MSANLCSAAAIVICKHKRRDSDIFYLAILTSDLLTSKLVQELYMRWTTILSFSCFLGIWRRGVVVSAFGVSMKLQLLYVGPDWSVSSNRNGQTTSVCNQSPRPTQPPTLSGREMSTGQRAVMLCGWRVKVGWLIPCVDKRLGGR